MSVFTHEAMHDHQMLVFIQDKAAGLKAIIALHNTRLGPALGGCRMYPYASETEALADVLRLSEGMTYKAALAGLPLGGGKAVILADPRKDKSPQLWRAFGDAVQNLQGLYITAEDSGTCVQDLHQVAQVCDYVVGIQQKPCIGGGWRSGDPSPSTAYGVYVGIQASVAFRLQRQDLRGLRIGIQGLGQVGMALAHLLHAQGARLYVQDIDADKQTKCAQVFGAQVLTEEDFWHADLDVIAPCALGGVLTQARAASIKAKVIAGAANNQLEDMRVADALKRRGILYAPDYVINAGGLIDVAYESQGQYQAAQVQAHIEQIGERLHGIYQQAQHQGRSTADIAQETALHCLSHAQAARHTQAMASASA